jgi:hypothetical protein
VILEWCLCGRLARLRERCPYEGGTGREPCDFKFKCANCPGVDSSWAKMAVESNAGGFFDRGVISLRSLGLEGGIR